jgi:hypothetical protein
MTSPAVVLRSKRMAAMELFKMGPAMDVYPPHVRPLAMSKLEAQSVGPPPFTPLRTVMSPLTRVSAGFAKYRAPLKSATLAWHMGEMRVGSKATGEKVTPPSWLSAYAWQSQEVAWALRMVT